MNAETKHTPGPWSMETVRTSCGLCHKVGPFPSPKSWQQDKPAHACIYYDYPPDGGSPELVANARLIAAAPEMAEALQAEEEADRLFDAADEYTYRAEGEGWLNDPAGSMHVTEAWDRARQAREHAKELRRAALLKAGG